MRPSGPSSERMGSSFGLLHLAKDYWACRIHCKLFTRNGQRDVPTLYRNGSVRMSSLLLRRTMLLLARNEGEAARCQYILPRQKPSEMEVLVVRHLGLPIFLAISESSLLPRPTATTVSDQGLDCPPPVVVVQSSATWHMRAMEKIEQWSQVGLQRRI